MSAPATPPGWAVGSPRACSTTTAPSTSARSWGTAPGRRASPPSGRGLGGLRRRDEATAHLAAAFAEYEDLGDENPDLVVLMGHYAANAGLIGQHDVAMRIAERQLVAAERLGLAELAADALLTRAQGGLYTGRVWEARALAQGALELYREVGAADGVLTASSLLSTIAALDSPAASLSVQRDAIDLARRLGRRSSEQLLVGNASEDARRTGDWEWAERELGQLLDADVDPETSVMARCGIEYYRLFRGTADRAEIDAVAREIANLQDPDMAASVDDIAATALYLAGDWAGAAREFIAAAERSALNLPYILPKAGRAAVLARDPDTASAVLERLHRHGARGRAIGADKAVIAAGLRALAGESAGALAGYRAAMATYRDLGLAWDEALLGLEAALVLGADDAEIAAWADRAQVVFAGLGARPMLALLDRATASGVPAAQTPVAESAVS